MVLQCSSITQRRVIDHSQVRLAEDVTRQGRAIPRTVRSVVGRQDRVFPTLLKTSLATLS
jgi:hypothetical protein